jgi:acylphosphatase
MFSEIQCVIKGKVQGVGFRDFVERYTREHGLFGWIRNNADGSVETLIQGTPDELKGCIEVLNQGSSLARVDGVAVEWRTPEKQLDEFKMLT